MKLPDVNVLLLATNAIEHGRHTGVVDRDFERFSGLSLEALGEAP